MQELLDHKKLKVLFVMSECSYPPVNGPQHHTMGLLNIAREIFECDVVGFSHGIQDIQRWDKFKTVFRDVSVKRLFPTEKGLKRNCRRIRNLLTLKLPILADFEGRELESYLRDEAFVGQYDIIHFDSFKVAKFQKLCRHMPSVLIPHDAYSLRNYRILKISKSLKAKVIALFRYVAFTLLEKSIYPGFSVVCPVSEIDTQWLKKKMPMLKLKTIGIPINHQFLEIRNETSKSRYIICAGLLSNDLGVQGCIDFLKGVTPYIVKNYPDMEIIFLGKSPLSKFSKLLNKTRGVKHIEWVEDYIEFLKGAYIYVYPHKCVSGIQTKIQQAMACGVPVISTSEVLDVIGAINGEHAFVCDNTEEMYERIKLLIEDFHTWEKISANARKLILEKYSEQVIMGQLKEVYLAVCKTKNLKMIFNDKE